MAGRAYGIFAGVQTLTGGNIEAAESTATLRPTGIARYFGAAFLGLWLLGWVVGEVVALVALLVLIAAAIPALANGQWPEGVEKFAGSSAPPFVFLFLLVWLTFWTIGGIAALTQFLRSVAGKDRLRLLPTGLEVTRCAGPFKRVRVIDRADIRRIRIRYHDKALVADTSCGCQLLSDLGTVPDRDAIGSWLRSALQRGPAAAVAIDTTEPPPGWDMTTGDEGGTELTQRRQRSRPVQAVILVVLTAILAGWIVRSRGDAIRDGYLILYLLTFAFAAGAVWLAWGRTAWLVRPGRLAFRRRFGPWVSEHPFEHAELAVESSTDSDGDSVYRLIVRSGTRRRIIQTAVNDDAEIADCARWFAARTGFALESRK